MTTTHLSPLGIPIKNYIFSEVSIEKKSVAAVGLYLSGRHGVSTEYNLVLVITDSAYYPKAIVYKDVSTIDHDGWYSFILEDILRLNVSETYNLFLYQCPKNIFSYVDFKTNFVDWFHSSNIKEYNELSSFSSDNIFGSGSGYGYGESDINVHGYGYGSAISDPLDYYDVIGVSGQEIGFDLNESGDFYGYGYGFESTLFRTDNTVSRAYRIYENFNDINYIDSEIFDDGTNVDSDYMNISIPQANLSELELSNRQDFVQSEKYGTEIEGNLITLSNLGPRLYLCDSTLWDAKDSELKIKWYNSNHNLSSNDLNYMDISNPENNLDKFKTKIICSPYYSGIYISDNSGSTWYPSNTYLNYNGSSRNISCVVLGQYGNWALAFDDTSETEKGKVFYIDLTLIEPFWTLLSTDILGKTVKTSVIINDNEILVGTSGNGVFRTLDGGISWEDFNIGLPDNCDVRQFFVKNDISTTYGYGYGYGEGLDYFDVFDQEGLLTGYGTDDFELIAEYGYGYGWEYGFSGGSNSIIYIATDSGVFRYTSFWQRIYPYPDQEGTETFSINITDHYIFIGKEEGIVRSVDQVFGTEEIVFEGDSEEDLFYYPLGLLKQRVTGIFSNKDNLSEIYVSQYGGVFVSKNNGGNFVPLSNLMPERKVKQLLANPINNRLIYAVTENIKFNSSGMTIILDSSGSMEANDPEGRRINLIKNIINGINTESISENTKSYYQLVSFGVPEKKYNTESGYEQYGIINETDGMISSVPTVLDKIDSLVNPSGEHYRTPLFQAIDIVSKGLIKDGSSWNYSDLKKSYEYKEIVSKFFTELDRFVIFITDGNNNILEESIMDIIGTDSAFSKIRGMFYIIGIGHNINYENLRLLKDNHPFGKLYLAPYKENIYNSELDSNFEDVSDIILNKERYRNRTGTWKRTISYDEVRKTKSIYFEANIPPSTSATISIRASKDKYIWSSWVEDLPCNTINSIALTGKYFEILLNLSSDYMSRSPEIKNISLITLEPKESSIIFDKRDFANGGRISEVILNSLDDFTLGNVSEDDLKCEFGIAQSNTSNFEFYNSIHSNGRTIMRRKDFERITSDDGYFFSTENGPWPSDATIEIYDTTNGILESVDSISENLYYSVPSSGLVVFYDKVSSSKKYSARISYPDGIYKIGMKATNFSESSINFKMHDLSMMFDKDEKNNRISRSALPLSASQLGEGDSYGVVSPSNISTTDNITTTISVQYINKDERYTGGKISLTTGQKVDIGYSDSYYKFYEQNASLSKFYVDDNHATSLGYTRINGKDGAILDKDVSLTSSNLFNYQINISVQSLEIGESISFIIGDTSKGSDGMPTWLYQENLLFEKEDQVIGEWETYFVVGDTNTTTTNASTGETISSGNGFDKTTYPVVKIGGLTASKLVVIAPTTVSSGSTFSFIVLAVDSRGFIDRNFVDDISISISSQDGSLNTTEYTYKTIDEGRKKFSGFIYDSPSSVCKIQATLNNNIYYSNPIVTDYTEKIKWGDVNVPTLFSEGRQDIEFAADYAMNTSLLNFIGISDDIEYLDQDEFNYIMKASGENTESDFCVLPGFRYRIKSSMGEHLVLYENTFSDEELPEIPLKSSSLTTAEEQIEQLVNSLLSFNYVSIPVHSPYAQLVKSDAHLAYIFANRSFDFNSYRNMVSYGSSSVANANIQSFITNNETSVEMFSEHGNTEEEGVYSNINFVKGQESAYVRHALRIGKKFGFVASSGGYSSRAGYYSGDNSKYVNDLPSSSNNPARGLTALRISSVNSHNVIEAIKQRKSYASTGARIYLEFSGYTTRGSVSVSSEMGGVIKDLEYTASYLAKNSNIFNFRAVADKSSINRIQIVRIRLTDDLSDTNDIILDSRNTDIASLSLSNFGEDTGKLVFEDTVIKEEFVNGQEYCYYLRITQADGHVAWSSPIWFNYGRTEGIRNESDVVDNQVGGVSLMEGSIDYSGVISNVPATITGSPYSSFPTKHLNILANTFDTVDGVSEPRSETRQSPYISVENSKTINLFVGNRKPIITGMRLLEDNGQEIIYGSHYVDFISKNEDISQKIDNSLNPKYNGTGLGDVNFKVLNSPSDPTSTRVKYYRNYLFGSMWQYNSSDVMDDSTIKLEYNSVYSYNGGPSLVKEPFVYKEGSVSHLLFSNYQTNYPENSIEKVAYNSGIDKNRVEEFAGLLENGDNLYNGYNLRLKYTNDSSQQSLRNFILSASTIPNIWKEKNIAYSSSPFIVKTSSDFEYSLYYLGWIKGGSLTDPKPVLAMFARRFSSFSDIASADPSKADTKICFIFSSSQDNYPQGYIPIRKTSFQTANFIPKDIREMDNWSPLHPAYSWPWMWLSVVKRENGIYYAFFNYLNKVNYSLNPKADDAPATGILYSLNGIDFYEYDTKTISETITPLQGKLFFHPYQSNGIWYAIYRNANITDIQSNINNLDLKWSRFNWSTQFSL